MGATTKNKIGCRMSGSPALMAKNAQRKLSAASTNTLTWLGVLIMLTREQFEEFIGGLKYAPNHFQRSVLESIALKDNGNIVVSALAGSGKTSLLVQAAQLLDFMGQHSATFIAFNVKIRDELCNRLPTGYV